MHTEAQIMNKDWPQKSQQQQNYICIRPTMLHLIYPDVFLLELNYNDTHDLWFRYIINYAQL